MATPIEESMSMSPDEVFWTRPGIEKGRTGLPKAPFTDQSRKDELDAEKLRLEILNLKRWWVQPAFIQAVFGSLIALGALVTGYYNGWFEVQRGRLEIQTAQLQDKRSQLLAQVERAANTGAQLSFQLEIAKADLDRETKARQQVSEALIQEKQRNDQFSADLNEIKKLAARSDAGVGDQIAKLEQKWVTIAKDREAHAASFKKRNEQLAQSNGQLPGQTTASAPSSTQTLTQNSTFPYDENKASEQLFRANATPAMIDIYNRLPPDQQRAMQVQAVLNHLEVVNQIATNSIKRGTDTKAAVTRNLQ